MYLIRRRTRRFWRALPVLFFVVACSSRPDSVRIGLAGPFSDSVGAPMRRAAELAVQQINAAGGIAGRPVELVLGDDAGDPDSAVEVATRLVGAGVVAVVGHVYSGTSLAAAPVYNRARVVQISPSSTAPALSDAGDWTFRVCPSDLQMGAALARFAAERLALSRGTILYLNDAYGRGLRQTFAGEFSRLGGVIEETDPYLGDRPDLSAYLDRLARQGTSQFVFLGGNLSEGEEALRAARARGLRIPLLGGDGLEGLEQAGALAEGSYLSNGYLAEVDTPRNREFRAAYGRRYPSASPPNQPAAASYDILFLLRDAIARAGTRPEALRGAIAGTGSTTPAFPGVTGEIGFDERGDVPRPRVIIGRVHAGRIQPVEGL